MHHFHTRQKAVVIGAGFAGLSAATSLAQHGYDVTVIEKNDQAGGRARMFTANGFLFDMGPSWYWMPDVMERYFNRFGRAVSDYYKLVRLDPSYQVIFSKEDALEIPADYEQLRLLFESMEKGGAAKLDRFLQEAKYKYEAGIHEFVYKPSVSVKEFAEWRFVKSLFQLDMLRSFSGHARQYFKNPRLLQILEFPVLFLGAMPSKTPALYSMMNYADMKLGTWYPMGGMYELVKAMCALAMEHHVELQLGITATKIRVKEQMATHVLTNDVTFETDVLVGAADYYHIENNLLDKESRSYSKRYWSKKTMAPSALIYYVGVAKKLNRLKHHNLFFEHDFNRHAKTIYETGEWPEQPLFYVCCPSRTDETVAPAGMENLFILIPVAAGLTDTETIRADYFNRVIQQLEAFCGENLKQHIVYERSYAGSDFLKDYHAYRGNAYGLANTLTQTAFMKPSIKSKKIKNLFFAGQLTVPGPGVPPAIISGQVVADYINGLFKQNIYERAF
ncbi:MAG: phytoene desaturase [Chitinophagaceae bacterium]|nr:phytoene desaturase [Chitinophagaceae bacterium]